MVLEEHSECHTPRKHVIGGQIHTESACAGGSLCIGRFDASYKSLIGLKRKIGIDGQVIADALLRASDLKNGVEIGDEYDDVTSMYKKIGPDSYIFDAKIPIADFCRVTETPEEELGDVGDAETLAGLLLEIKGDFPTTKETLVLGAMHFHVMKMERHRIVKVSLRIMREMKENIG